MTTIISSMLQSIFVREEIRILFVGLDAAGKTTVLYKMKLGEVVTTIPTIGFNVETIQHRGKNITIWDVGGCDKIRPLWRHYFANTAALVMVVDSHDLDRLGTPESTGYDSASGLLRSMMLEDELRNAVLLVYCNKQDLATARDSSYIIDRLGLSSYRHNTVVVQSCSALSGDGLLEGMDQLINALDEQKRGCTPSNPFSGSNDHPSSPPPPPPPPSMPTVRVAPTEEERLATTLEEWLERVDEPDDEFLRKLEDFTLESWDHRTHLRIAWIIINRDGRAIGTPKIFHLIQQFIINSPRTQRASSNTRGTTFHETMTFFWIHMVHYAIVATKLPRPDFKVFLLMNPQLVNGGLFMKYYSRKLMLHTPEARASVMLPDILPLPSRIPSDKTIQNVELLASGAKNIRLPQISNMSDGKVFALFQSHVLPAWGHDVKLRIIYVMLNLFGRSKGGVDTILDKLKAFEGEHFHISETYFWIQMITFYMLALEKHLGLPSLWRYGKLSTVESTNSESSNEPGIVVETVHSTSTSQSQDVTSVLRKPTDFSPSNELLDVLLENALSYEEFLSRAKDDRTIAPLGFASTLIDQYYSIKLLDSEACKMEFALPDIKPLPSIVR